MLTSDEIYNNLVATSLKMSIYSVWWYANWMDLTTGLRRKNVNSQTKDESKLEQEK